jgi:hypothetical protein
MVGCPRGARAQEVACNNSKTKAKGNAVTGWRVLLKCCCHRMGNAVVVVLSPPRPSGSYLLDVAGSPKIVRPGFRGPRIGLDHIGVEIHLRLLIVVGRKVLLFFINSLGFELFHRKLKIAKDPPLSKAKQGMLLSHSRGCEFRNPCRFTMPCLPYYNTVYICV